MATKSVLGGLMQRVATKEFTGQPFADRYVTAEDLKKQAEANKRKPKKKMKRRRRR